MVDRDDVGRRQALGILLRHELGCVVRGERVVEVLTAGHDEDVEAHALGDFSHGVFELQGGLLDHLLSLLEHALGALSVAAEQGETTDDERRGGNHRHQTQSAVEPAVDHFAPDDP